MYIWDVLNVNANRMKLLLRNTQRCLNHVFLLEQLKNYQGGKCLTQRQSLGPYDMEGHARKCVERYCELADKVVEQFTKFQVLAWMIMNSNRKNLNQY